LIRKPVVAGRFYPEEKKELLKELKSSFDSVSSEFNKYIFKDDKIFGGISPHAGYVFSGSAAASLYACIDKELLKDPVFIILGPDHTGLSRPLAVSDADYWETPLGKAKVSSYLKDKVKDIDHFELDEESHKHEHSIEVQIPFIQYIMDDREFEILPVGVSIHEKESLKNAAKSLKRLFDTVTERDVIFIISSDFSHYVSKEKARTLDMPAIDNIKEMESDRLFDYVYKNNISICGISPILLFSYAFSDKVKGKLLKYTDSSAASPMDKVVAYASIIYLQRG